MILYFNVFLREFSLAFWFHVLSGVFLIKNLHNVVLLWENVVSAYEYAVKCWTHVHNILWSVGHIHNILWSVGHTYTISCDMLDTRTQYLVMCWTHVHNILWYVGHTYTISCEVLDTRTQYFVICWTHVHNTSKDSSGSFKLRGHYNANAQTQKVSLLNFSTGP
jgi:hypothetical protein